MLAVIFSNLTKFYQDPESFIMITSSHVKIILENPPRGVGLCLLKISQVFYKSNICNMCGCVFEIFLKNVCIDDNTLNPRKKYFKSKQERDHDGRDTVYFEHYLKNRTIRKVKTFNDF